MSVSSRSLYRPIDVVRTYLSTLSLNKHPTSIRLSIDIIKYHPTRVLCFDDVQTLRAKRGTNNRSLPTRKRCRVHRVHMIPLDFRDADANELFINGV